MKSTPHASQYARTEIHGFTLVEILMAIGIIGLLAAVAVPQYQRYVARSHAAELLLKFDAVKTNLGSLISSGNVQVNCGTVPAVVHAANLKSEYAGMDVGFEPVTGGFTPVLRYCATIEGRGPQAVQVVREAHTVMSRSASISQPVVLGDAAASFAVRLAGDTVLCKALPAAKPADICAKPMGLTMQADVMRLASGAIVPGGYHLHTQGNPFAMTVEMTILGVPPPGGAVLFNYGNYVDDHNAFSLWNPGSLTVAILGNDFNTGLNLRDGQTHRVSVSWDGATQTLAVYDNGNLVKTFTGAGRGYALNGNAEMSIGVKNKSPGFFEEGTRFSGEILRTSVVQRAMTAAELATPVFQTMAGKSELLMDVTVENGKVVDTTGHHDMREAGGVSVTQAEVATALVLKP
ncbi:LamG-like jellyroll fold domain-containing protein [Undibacterium parvum]|uniref:Prepilin-type N-terminal cleavage/methylation domain-containing protein n=2 Tax=Undibacterium TaxID=401469 RepID=A0A6M4A768_9BURK|nr:LamG-like jellyroll fold domain-containing protein [Undibacterium parvum]AZP12276.1 prepilin-type N-terminal cleavage/methylation domain-containing protein [Undibacterium parvum]QJQ06560.1 prepilin-type N-terminal cleavage/methylation domain-containing protein [Undibacterium piscinae]